MAFDRGIAPCGENCANRIKRGTKIPPPPAPPALAKEDPTKTRIVLPTSYPFIGKRDLWSVDNVDVEFPSSSQCDDVSCTFSFSLRCSAIHEVMKMKTLRSRSRDVEKDLGIFFFSGVCRLKTEEPQKLLLISETLEN